MKKIYKVLSIIMVAAMALSLAACGSDKPDSNDVDGAVVSGTPAPDSATEDTEDTEIDPDYTVDTNQYAWTTSHEAADFSMSDMMAANSTFNLVEGGSGKAVLTNMKQYVVDEETLKATDEVEYESDIYRWIDEDGSIHWYRDTHGVGTDSYVVLDSTGVGYRLDKSTDGTLKTLVLTDGATYQEAYTTLNSLYGSDAITAPYAIESEAADGTEETEETVYSEVVADATYIAPVQQDGTMYDIYIDDNMVVKAAVIENSLGCIEVDTVSIVDVPTTTVFDDITADEEKAEFKFTVDGTEYTMELYKGYPMTIYTASDDAMITAASEVVLDDSTETLDLQSGVTFTVKDANSFVIVNTVTDTEDTEVVEDTEVTDEANDAEADSTESDATTDK